jgi:anti-repressor protein
MIENDKNFIPVYKTDKNIKVVKGRELHEGLSVQKAFSTWIKSQLEYIDAIENKDFFPLKEESKGGRPSIDYILKLETAKEICLVAGASNRANPELKKKSKEYRRYLINVEEKYKELQNQLIQRNTILPKELKCEMDDFIKEAKEIKGLVHVKKKDSNTYVKQIKRYLGINKISDDKYGYNTIKDMFLSKFEVDKFEDITVSPENILELDKICKSYTRKFEQISIFD